MVAVGMASDKGPVQETNQDACCALVAHTAAGEVSMAVVCDGVGGLYRGDMASAHVVHGFATWFKDELSELVVDMRAGTRDLASIGPAWTELLRVLNAQLQERGRKSDMPCATTCTAVIVCGGRFAACQVGDSRLYHMRRESCVQVTQDQTLVEKLFSEGCIDEAEKATHPSRNVILQAVGAQSELEPDFYEGEVHEGDVLVLCSDGACRRILPDVFNEVFVCADTSVDGALDCACRTVIDLCLEAGETDNLTAVCVVPEPLPSWGATVVVDRDAA